jgi:Mg2+/Co2+ transporter CorB
MFLLAACILIPRSLSDQRIYANKIKPLRKDGHRLLVTLLLANMIVNESLPVIADPVLGGGVQGVAVSTVLIVMCVFFSRSLHPSLRPLMSHDSSQ